MASDIGLIVRQVGLEVHVKFCTYVSNHCSDLQPVPFVVVNESIRIRPMEPTVLNEKQSV